jgi:nucleoside-diphosphate-sugar epimerase
MKVIVTGSSGFIGHRLVTYLALRGFQVLAMQRQAPRRQTIGVDFQKYDLASTLDDSKFDGASYLVHTAYQPYSNRDKSANEVNSRGTQQLIEACKERDIKIVFLSTMSAHDQAESDYGISKLEIEKLFNLKQDLVLKLGLVLGDGGFFYKIRNIITDSKLVPLVAGGKLIQTVALADLFALLDIAMKERITGIYAIGELHPVPLSVLYKTIASTAQKKPLFVPVPLSLILSACTIAEAFGITLPITSENVLGLKKMRTFKTDDIATVFGYHLESYDKAISNLQIQRNDV